MTERFFKDWIVPTIYAMQAVFDEIEWDARLDPHNHVPHFPFSITAITDTFPVFIEAPLDPFLNGLFWGAKYNRHCVKVGISGISFVRSFFPLLSFFFFPDNFFFFFFLILSDILRKNLLLLRDSCM